MCFWNKAKVLVFQKRHFASKHVKKFASEMHLKVFDDLEKAKKSHLLLYESPSEENFC